MGCIRREPFLRGQMHVKPYGKWHSHRGRRDSKSHREVNSLLEISFQTCRKFATDFAENFANFTLEIAGA